MRAQKKKTCLKPKFRGLFIVLMLAVPLLLLCVFWLMANIETFRLAFRDPMDLEWTFDNFVKFWDQVSSTNGSIFIAIKNTLIYFVAINVVAFLLNLVVAYFLYKKIFLSRFFRVIFYMPAIISAVALTTVFKEFISPDGPLGKICEIFGIQMSPKGLLGQEETATATIVVYCFWTGFTTNMLLFSSALSRIPVEILEAIKLDGCGTFRTIWSFVIPLIWPTMSTLFIFSLTGIFNAGGPILLFTNGNYNTSTIAYWIFIQVYGNGTVGGSGSYGLVSAAGLVFTAVGVPIIMLTKWLLERIPVVEY